MFNPDGPIIPQYQLFLDPVRAFLYHEDDHPDDGFFLEAWETDAMDAASDLVAKEDA